MVPPMSRLSCRAIDFFSILQNNYSGFIVKTPGERSKNIFLNTDTFLGFTGFPTKFVSGFRDLYVKICYYGKEGFPYPNVLILVEIN
jgi:hypothetical protein